MRLVKETRAVKNATNALRNGAIGRCYSTVLKEKRLLSLAEKEGVVIEILSYNKAFIAGDLPSLTYQIVSFTK